MVDELTTPPHAPSPVLVRVLDVTGALAIAVATAPLWVAAAVTIRLVDGTPVLHTAVRVGRWGTPFVLFKFRTMEIGDRTASGEVLPVTFLGDARVTPLGTWLRRTKLDELPQLWNVLRGDMSLVGPRPEDPRYVQHYSPAQRVLLSVRPGLTSPATVAYRHEEAMLAEHSDPEYAYVEEMQPAKLSLDLAWLEQRSLRGDMRVLVATVRALFSTRSSTCS